MNECIVKPKNELVITSSRNNDLKVMKRTAIC